ncbi:hypothetical protein [Kribbella sp. NPDC003557]|uniref:hypothetical protein n=1 Tax=Kribbella sp. NPDC003557 TaxID=3154449 RepID=UPI00339F4247
MSEGAEELLEQALKTESRTASTLARAARDLTEHTPPKFIVGVSTVLHQAAQFAPAAEQAAHEFRFAYWRKTLHPESWISDTLLQVKSRQLKEALEAAAQKADKALADRIRAEITNVDKALAWLPAKGAPKLAPTRVTKLGKLESFLYSTAAHNDATLDPLRTALARWHDAASGFDPAELAAARDELCANLGAISTKKATTKVLGRSSTYVKAVQEATKALTKQLPDEGALEVLGQLGVAVGDLLRAQRAAGITKRTLFWRHLSPAIEASPNAWGRLGRKIASLEPVKASEIEKVKALVTRVRAALAEAVGTASPAYQSSMSRAVRRAETLAATLNTGAVRSGATPAWKTVKPNAAIFAPGATGKAGKLFVDDAVLVVNETLNPPKAYVLFAGQIKAGDASSRNAIAQLIEDQTRLFSGSLTIGGREFAMVPPTDLAWVQRVFVGTTRPSGSAALTGLVQHIDAPLDAAALDDLALAWLVRSGKVVP